MQAERRRACEIALFGSDCAYDFFALVRRARPLRSAFFLLQRAARTGGVRRGFALQRSEAPERLSAATSFAFRIR